MLCHISFFVISFILLAENSRQEVVYEHKRLAQPNQGKF